MIEFTAVIAPPEIVTLAWNFVPVPVVPVTIALALMAAMVLGAAVGIDAMVSFGQGLFSRG